MNINKSPKSIGVRAWRKFFRAVDTSVGGILCREQLQRPVFVLGCGRSGTTILGTVLSHHSMVTYLNERRDLWVACYPITDIWGKKARSRGGKLTLTSRDEIPERSKKLHQLFKWQTLRSGSPILVEKLPINNFRVSFLQAIFPDALFVHILRNGIEVARSIEREAGWYAKYNYRWDLIEEYAKSRPETRDLVDLCNTDYEKGLLEWRLSLDTFYSSTDMIDSDRILEITYDELMQDPMQTTSKILGFLKLPSDDNSLKFAENNLARRHPKVTGEFRNKEMEIAGTYLERWY